MTRKSGASRTFCLKLHLAYFKMGESGDHKDTRLENSLAPFLLSSTHSALKVQVSLVIVGTNRYNWTAYSFVDNARQMDHDTNPLLTRIRNTDVVADPRIIFVEHVQYHVSHVLCEYKRLARVIESECSALVSVHSGSTGLVYSFDL